MHHLPLLSRFNLFGTASRLIRYCLCGVVRAKGHVFDESDPEKQQVEWGVDMASEHERYLCEVVFKKPVIVYNYPCAIKAFYMRRNDPGTDGAPGLTCAAMDVLGNRGTRTERRG